MTVDGNPLNINYCPHCRAKEEDLNELSDEGDYYQWCADQGDV